jgi:2-dehydro-3-deoxyphosphogalactonate aldolase
MKLANVRTFVVQTPPPYAGGALWFFVRLETDSGLVGWGETAVLGTLHGLEDSYESLVQQIFEGYLRNRNPMDREALYHKMYEGMMAQHPDYVGMGVVSAIDIALWDIAGKHLNTPVYNLLGGKYRDRVRTYTYIYDLESPGGTVGTWTGDPERLGVLAAQLADEGFTGLKFDPLPQSAPRRLPAAPWEITLAEYDHAERAVAAVREAVGTRADILIGTHGQTTPSAARRLAARVERYDPLWLEEPCPPENYKQMGEIARRTSIPIATGERLVGIHEFQNLFEHSGCAFAQPDLGSCGGITACKKIASLAEANYVLMAPHIWGGPIITAAALQIDANIPNFLIQESIYKSRDFFDEVVVETFEWDNGDLIPSERPGIGIDLNEEALEAHRGSLENLRHQRREQSSKS